MSGEPINLITVCTQRYPMIYPEVLHRRFADLSSLDVSHYCLTDRPHEVGDWASPLEPEKLSSGWWNKVNLFGSQMPEGWLLYMDLDIVICENFDDEIRSTIVLDAPINCVSDAVNWMNVKFSSSFMLLKKNAAPHVFQNFIANEPSLINREGGDQVWVGPQLDVVNYIDETFPNLKKNLKFHLADQVDGKFAFPMELPKGVKLVDCGGRPKPHELAALPYVRAAWHDIAAQYVSAPTNKS